MNTFFTPDRLRSLFQNQFNLSEWVTYLQQFFLADELRVKPEPLDTTNEQGYYLGAINTPDHYHIGLFHYVITHGSVVNRRVGLRKLVEQFTHKRWGDFDAALVVFSSHDHWRLSLICDIDGEATSPKRFTYVFGSRDLLYRTPIERFSRLQKEGVTFAKMREAFSVEALSDEFFERYREQYADFVEYVTGKRYVKSGTKWVERVMGPANEELISAFKQDEKRVRDYIKKMMGRITFLHFLQRKGWMCGDLNYMQHLFERSPYQDNYLDAVLEPLFFGILNTRPEEREALFTAKGWNLNLLSEWKSIPYLNGGLFECEAEDLTTCRFPVEYFQRLFQFFSEYNFTIDENDPTDAEVGVDPEMLGKIFENLLEDNKDKGAFYTPKEIVRYMCRESLIAYLVTQSMERGNTNPREKVEASIRDLLNKPEEIVPRMNERQKREFGESLYRLKICDPAIGSGAFPMGLLNELVRLRSLIDAWAKDDNGKPMVGDYAALKSEIICNNIYGVDIERGAIDIARLRFWLSIVVDEVTPHTLPNLDYKFMQGNSLITTFNGEYINLDSKQEHANIVKMRNEKKHLYELKQQYYTATGERKHQLNVDIKDSILSLIALQLDFEYRQWFDHHNTMNYLPGMGIPQQLTFADIKQKLPAEKQRMCDIGSALRKQLHDESKPLAERAKIDIRFFDWRMMFTEVFEGQNPGFDIVIGNPPYIGEKGHKDLFTPIKSNSNLGQFYLGKMDYFYFFFHLAFNISNNKGVCTFITTNYYPTALGARKLRADIKERVNIKHLFNFGELRLFENAPGQHDMISIFTKDRCDDMCKIIDVHKKGVLSPQMFASLITHQDTDSSYSNVTQKRLFDGEESYIRLQQDNGDNLLSSILSKIEADNKKLSQIATVNQGIVSGADKVTNKHLSNYLIDALKDDGIFTLSNHNPNDKTVIRDIMRCDEKQLLKPFYKNSDISKYYTYNDIEKYILFIGKDIQNESELSINYPIIYDHLLPFKNIMVDKRISLNEKVEQWFTLNRGTGHPEIFVSPKIVCPQRSKVNTFGYNECDWYATSDVFYVTNPQSDYNIKYILSLLNSKLYYLWLYHKGKRKGEVLELTAKPLSEIPIKKASKDMQDKIIEVVNTIIEQKKQNPNYDTSAFEHIIDQYVYEIYGITDSEVKYINHTIKR